jgi:hypothetical protein
MKISLIFFIKRVLALFNSHRENNFYFTLYLTLPLEGEGNWVNQEGLRPSWTPRKYGK